MTTGQCTTCQCATLHDCDLSHPDEPVEIGRFVTMGLNLDAATKDLNELLPLQIFREFTETLPSSSQGFFAVSILIFFDLSRLVVPLTVGEQE